MKELIYKEDAIAICKRFASAKYRVPYLEDTFNALPAVEPKQGEWIVTQENGTHNYIYRCSVCEWYEYHAYPDAKGHNFCPNCGARMKGGNQ